MPKTFTLRLPTSTTDRLATRARRAQEPARTVAQRYVEEGLRHDEHPLVHFVDGPSGRRAALLGTGLDVWEAIETVRDNGGDLQAAAEYLEIPLHLVQAAVTYYGAFTEEIDDRIEENQREAQEAHGAWLAGQQALGR
jgi:uncharacterized protein (DUF433 family)